VIQLHRSNGDPLTGQEFLQVRRKAESQFRERIHRLIASNTSEPLIRVVMAAFLQGIIVGAEMEGNDVD